jgi:hypothetical protein
VTANTWHSCTRIDLDDAFAESEPGVREAFDSFVGRIARCGPISVIAQRSRIVVMARVRFAGGFVRRSKLVASFSLPRRLAEPRFRTASYGPHWVVHRFDVRQPADLEIDGLDEWLCESYREMGLQEAVRRRAAARARRS